MKQAELAPKLIEEEPLVAIADDERIAFLSLGRGSLALIYGAASGTLIEALARRYGWVISFDWVDPRGDDRLSSVAGRVERRTFEPGATFTFDGEADLAVLLWAQPFIGSADDWIGALRSGMRRLGQLVIIERVARPLLLEQALTGELMDLWTESFAATGAPLQPGVDGDRLMTLLSEGGATHPRRKVFTDPDLLAAPEFWREDARRLCDWLARNDSPLPTADALRSLRERRRWRGEWRRFPPPRRRCK